MTKNEGYEAYIQASFRRARDAAQRTGVPQCDVTVPRQGAFPEHQCLLAGKYDGKCWKHVKGMSARQRQIEAAVKLLREEGYTVRKGEEHGRTVTAALPDYE